MSPEQRAIRVRLAENLERAGYHDDAIGVRQSIEWSDAGLGRLLADLRTCIACGAKTDENGTLPCGH